MGYNAAVNPDGRGGRPIKFVIGKARRNRFSFAMQHRMLCVSALKYCGTCGQDKPPSEFNKSVREPDGHQSRCRTCQADYYATNRDRYLPGLQERRRRQVAMLSRYAWDHLLTHPCVDCGEPDPMVLDFDHVSGMKVMGISRMVANGGSLEALQEEIAKCVSRCANCHRRKTARERGYYAWLTASPIF